VAAIGRGKSLRATTPWTDSARNKAVRAWAERNVKRLRKPEGVAQLSEVNSVLVAALVLETSQGKKPHGRAVRRWAHMPGVRQMLTDEFLGILKETDDAHQSVGISKLGSHFEEGFFGI
jgi:hypothetical protein